MNKDNSFELEIFLNQGLLRNFYTDTLTSIEERESLIEEKREHWLKEKIFKIKENVLFNNLEPGYLSNLDLNLSNIFYFKHYLNTVQDFETLDFNSLLLLRMNYLRQSNSSKEENSNKLLSSEEIRNNEKNFLTFLEQNSKKEIKDNMISLISSLICILQANEHDEEIIFRLLENIYLNSIRHFSNKSFESSTMIDQNLRTLFNLFEKKLFSSKIELESITQIIHKLTLIGFHTGCFSLVLLCLYKLKELKIAINNYDTIINTFYSTLLEKTISLPNKERNFQSFDFITPEPVNISICADENFIFLITQMENHFNIHQIGSGFNGTLTGKIYKQKNFDSNNKVVKNLKIMNNEIKDEILVVYSDGDSAHLLQYSKDSLNCTSKEIKLESEVVNIFHSQDSVYFLTKKKEQNAMLIESEETNSVSTFNLHTMYLDDYSIKKHQDNSNNYLNFSSRKNFNFLDEKIFFLSEKEVKILNLETMRIDEDLTKFYNNYINDMNEIYDTKDISTFFYNKYHNCLITSNFTNSKVSLKYYYNTYSQPFTFKYHCSSLNNMNHVVENLNKNLPPLKETSRFDNINKFLIYKPYEENLFYSLNENLSNNYFSLMYWYLTKIILKFGNLKNSYKNHSKPLYEGYEEIYLKKISNNLSREVFTTIWERSFSKSNDEEELNSNLIFLYSLFSNILDINGNIDLFLGDKLDLIFNRLFEIITLKSSSQEYTIILINLLIRSSRSLKDKSDYLKKMIKSVSDIKLDINTKLIFLNLILSYYEGKKLDFELFETVINFESGEILNLFSKENSCIENRSAILFITKFQKLFFKSFINEIDFEEESEGMKIFNFVLEKFYSLLKGEKEKLKANKLSEDFHKYFNNYSLLANINLFIINMVSTKYLELENELSNSENKILRQKTINKLCPFKYLSKIINILTLLDEIGWAQQSSTKFDLFKEKIYTFETEHPCESDTKRAIEFSFENSSASVVKYKFDSMSLMNPANKVHLKHGQISHSLNSELLPAHWQELKLKEGNTFSLTYEPFNPQKDDKTYQYSWGFRFLCQNSDENRTHADILMDIRRSLIFSLCRSIKASLIVSPSPVSLDSDKEKENLKKETKINKLYDALFSSKLLANISIIKEEEEIKSNGEYLQYLNSTINCVSDSTIQEKLKQMLVSETYLEGAKVKNEVEKIIDGIIKNDDEYYKRGINLLHKFFLQKNIWGQSGKEIKHLVIYLFVIILKHEKLIIRYDEFLQFLNTSFDSINSGNMNEIVNFEFFLKVYSECSKVRVWFNEKKMHIAENISNQSNLDQESKEKLSDQEITSYILKITEKAQFLLSAINVALEEETGRKVEQMQISPRGKIKEYTPHHQDLINNLLIYIKTDEVEIKKLSEKISAQNEKAKSKEKALLFFNLILCLVNNQQDLRDVLFWVEKSFKLDNRSIDASNLIYFDDDLIGADSLYIEKVKSQFYSYISILISKIRTQDSFNPEKSHYEILTSLILSQSLIWKIKKRDYSFLKNSKFFDIFSKNSVFSGIMNKNILKSSDSISESQYSKECIDYEYLQNCLTNLLMIYSLQVFDKLNFEMIIESSPKSLELKQGGLISPRGATALLSFIRKKSEISETESFKIIDKITDVILHQMENYLNDFRELIEEGVSELSLDEDKLNSYLGLLYRGLSFNSIIIKHFMKRNFDFLAIILEIFLLTSDKNRYFLIKFIHLFTLYENDDDFFQTSMDVFKSSLERRFPHFSQEINKTLVKDSSASEFFVSFLFKLVLALLDKENFMFMTTQSDEQLAWEVIAYMRSLLVLKDNVINKDLIKLLQRIIENRKTLTNEYSLTLILLGAGYNKLRVGSKIFVDSHHLLEKSKSSNVYDYCPENTAQEEKKVAVVLGFTESGKNPFVVDETIDSFSFKSFSYSVNKFALCVLEENLTKENIKTFAYDTLILDCESINIVPDTEILFDVISQLDLLPLLVEDMLVDQSHHTKFLTLKLIKNILFKKETGESDKDNNINNLDLKSTFGNILKLKKEEVVQKLSDLSLGAINIKHYQVPLEKLEKISYETILLEKKEEVKEQGNEKPETSLSISPDYNSLFIRFNSNLIKEIPLLMAFYWDELPRNKYYRIFPYKLQNFSQINSESILFMDTSQVKDLLSQNSDARINNPNIVAIITNESLVNQREFLDNLNSEFVPIICINDADYHSCISSLFEQIPNEEFEELFLQSVQRDFSSLIDIPPMMVDETVRFGQRDLVLKILNEETSQTVKGSDKNKNKATTTLIKLNALIARRILIFILFNYANLTKPFMDCKNFCKILKLLVFEDNINKESEINELISLFIDSLKPSLFEFDHKVASVLLDLNFFNKLNYIDHALISNVDFEEDLLNFENVENNLKLIFAVIKGLKKTFNSSSSESSLSANFSLVKDYEMKLSHALIFKVDDFLIRNKETGGFILDVLMITLRDIYDSLEQRDDENIKVSIKNFTFLFKSEEFLRIANRVKDIFEKNTELKLDNIESRIVNFFIIYLDLALLVLCRYNIDLNLEYFIESKIMNLYYSYSLLNKKFTSLEFFTLFCQMRDLNNKSSEVHSINQDFFYKDSTSSTPHIMKFSFENSDGVCIKIDSENLNIDPEALVFIYSDKECNTYSLQDYFNCDLNKEVYIKNSSGNTFYISLPYKNFRHQLFGAGSNENQSLGCQGENNKYYNIPQKAVGITSNNIKSFKFGYYHCFVASTDEKLFVCGRDQGSSLRDGNESNIYTLNSGFNDIVAREGIVNIWVNNYNASILLTKSNKLYGCGINTDSCLSNASAIHNSTSTPYEMTRIEGKIKMVSCGYKTSMIVMEDGTAYTVGCNTYHEAGNMLSNEIIREYFRLVVPGKIVDAVAGEHFFLLLIKEESSNKVRLYSMGCNEQGRCGVDNDHSHKLQRCKGVENLEFVKIASRNLSSAAVTNTGLLYTFGSNEKGNLGHGTTTDYYRPTLVETLKGYIVDDVSISHNHMIVIARDRVNGQKALFGSGTNEYGSLMFENLSISSRVPKKITYFKEKESSLLPVRLATSRYQSYVLTLENQMSQDRVVGECKSCNSQIKDLLFIRPISAAGNNGQNGMIQNDMDYYDLLCENCITAKIGSEIVYSINVKTKNLSPGMLPFSKDIISTLSSQNSLNNNISLTMDSVGNDISSNISNNLSITDNILFLENDIFNPEESNQQFSYICVDCSLEIKNKVFISTEDSCLILCSKCLSSCSSKVQYPQVFYVMNKVRISSNSKKKFPHLNLSKALWNIEKSEKPIFSIKITPKPSQIMSLLRLSKEKSLLENYSKWRRMNNGHLIELNKLKDEVEGLIRDGTLKGFEGIHLNSAQSMTSQPLMDYLKSTENEKYSLLKNLDQEELTLLNELSASINESIFYLMNLTYNMKEKGFLHKAITDNLCLVSSKARMDIFHERIDKMKIAVNPSEIEMPINRLKALKFYEKKTIDTTGENTIFAQLFHKMKKYPLNNYLCKKDCRLFQVKLVGEGATDYGGPYREVFSTACEELHSIHLDLFIKSPNNRNEVGAMRDKYIPNPSAKSAMQVDMFFFIGCLIGSAISSGLLLNLNIHPTIWSLILNQEIKFSDFETLDKLFFKYIVEMEKFNGNQNDFEAQFMDQFFMILLSDGSEFELIPQGRKTPVTLENKQKFTHLAKNARINEFKIQVESIRYGLINVIPDNILSILTGKEVELLSCGEPTLNIDVLKKYTEYQYFSASDSTIKYFWNTMESFSNEEKVSYLKYVWGRSRLPDPNIFPFSHVITKMSHSQPDSRLPAATTCYFTLKLPAYSSQEIMTQKLKYVITNCAEIDADFNVSNTPDID